MPNMLVVLIPIPLPRNRSSTPRRWARNDMKPLPQYDIRVSATPMNCQRQQRNVFNE